MFGRIHIALVLFACMLPLGAVQAQDLPPPSGKVILTVTGKIAVTNAPGAAQFDRAMLERLGVRTLKTSTNWTDGVNTFEGVLVRDVLDKIGAKGQTASAAALNDYAIDIPMSDFKNYDVILAFRMDGKELLPSDRGPLWIVYPKDEQSELQNVRLDSRWVWQLKSLTVQ